MAGRNLEFFGDRADYTQKLWDRQGGKCAVSGEPLKRDEVFVHHVVPAGHGGQRSQETDRHIKDPMKNGVLLSKESHYVVHDSGKFKDGAVAPASYFKHAYGADSKKEFKEWCAKSEQCWDKLFPKKMTEQQAPEVKPKSIEGKTRDF